MLTKKSRIKEVYRHPVGHDIIKKILLQMNINEKIIENPNMTDLGYPFKIPAFEKIIYTILNAIPGNK